MFIDEDCQSSHKVFPWGISIEGKLILVEGGVGELV